MSEAVSSSQGARPGAVSQDERYRTSQRVTLVGAAINAVLAAGKVVFGFVGQSQALVADGIHSFSDLVSDAFVWYGARHGSQEADEDHPYGHARIETAVTVALGLLLIAIGVGIMVDAVQRLFDTTRLLHPGVLALAVAALSVLAKEWLYHYTVRAAKKLRSNLLRANAWHHRSDAISSVVVIVGVAGTMAGLDYLDALAAAFVALMVAKIGWDLGWQAIKELVDTGLETERVEAIRKAIGEVQGVQALHMLRTRRMGPDALVDVHILVHPKCSVSEGHQIAEAVRARVVRDIEEVTDVMVHIDPENDEVRPVNIRLPLREELIERLREQWSHIGEAERIEKITLHYLRGRVQVEVVLPLAVLGRDAEQADRRLKALFEKAAASNREVEHVALYYH